jgi:hypothetical protein
MPTPPSLFHYSSELYSSLLSNQPGANQIFISAQLCLNQGFSSPCVFLNSLLKSTVQGITETFTKHGKDIPMARTHHNYKASRNSNKQ